MQKRFFARYDLEYLSFKIATQGIMQLPDKVEAIKNIAVPTTKKIAKINRLNLLL